LRIEILACNLIAQKYRQKAIGRGRERHAYQIGARKPVGRNLRTKVIRHKHSPMNNKNCGRPQNCGPNGKVILHVTCPRVILWKDPPLSIHSRHHEGFVAGQIVVLEPQIMINQSRSKIGVVTDPVASNPGIHKRERQEKQYE
jgi:hypothetical protein